jgi:DNA ligase (NAD+)
VLIRASTRGDGDVGEVITHNAKAIDGIPANIPYRQRLVVVGEAYITKPAFERLQNTLRDGSGNAYKNARNMAAGSIRCYDSAACAGRGVVFSPFGVVEGLDGDLETSTSKALKLTELARLGFSPCMFRVLKANSTEQELANTISELRASAEHSGVPVDGIVVSYDDIPFSLSRGRTGHHYKDGIAFKFEDELYGTILRGIEWTPSRSGELSPVALFDTVEIDGCEVSRASLHNLTFIRELELMPGCRILVSKRNMIIPHIEENLDKGRFNAKTLYPESCPCCGLPTRVDVETLRCDNADCAMQNLRKFVHFAGKKAMDIEGLSEATLEKFIGKGWLRGFTDVYRLYEHSSEIQRLEGFGEKSWLRLYDAIERSRNTTFERFVVSMDIPMVGRTASKELSRYFNGDVNALETAVNAGFDFTVLNDFGEVLHRNIHSWFRIKENMNLWRGLQTMITIEKANTIPATESNPFTGSTIVATGTLEHFTRNGINAKIEQLGAKAGSAVSKSTDYLICGKNAGSKLSKAMELGVTVLSEQEFLTMTGSV